MPSTTLQVLLLGPPQIRLEERPVEVRERKAMALLSYLALSPTVRGRDDLAVFLWPERPKARERLRHALWAAKKAIGQDHLIIQREIIGLRLDETVSVDVLEFRRLLTAYQTHGHGAQEVCDRCLESLGAAVELYRADFLSAFTLADSPAFDDWQTYQTEALRQEFGDALGRLVRLHSNRREFELAFEYGRRRLTLDPLNEPAQRELMRVYAWSGRPAVALRQYEEFVAQLGDEIGVPPDQETIELAEAIRAGDVAPPAPATAAAKDVTSRPVLAELDDRRGMVRNLPKESSALVGRRRELEEVVRLLADEPECRLLTLAGLGGVGKTSLSVRTSIDAAASFEQGAAFVYLAQVDEAAYLPIAIASALDISLRGPIEPKAALTNALRNWELLLVLDNFEQLLDSGATELVAELLEKTGKLKLLVTSRERLNLSGEWCFELGGLDYPANDTAEGDGLEDFGAVQLFLQSVRRVRPDLELTGENRQQMLRICRLVDGLPLALKLAAPWSRIMTFRQIGDEVESNLGFLESSLRDIPDRHRNIRAVFDHSWTLLGEDEREAFLKLSVFKGGFSRQAAERVAGASVPMLLRLADKSLIQRSGDGRFQIHELLRRYASEKLSEWPRHREAARDVHASYFATYLSTRQESIRGVRQDQIVAELSAESDNIRAAWIWACSTGDVAALAKSAECLVGYLYFADRFQEGKTLFGQGVDSLEALSGNLEAGDTDGSTFDLAHSLVNLGHGFFINHLGHPKEALSLLERGVHLMRGIRPTPKRRLALSLYWLGQAYIFLGEYAKSLEVHYQALKMYQEIGNKDGEGYISRHIGVAEGYSGNYQLARDYLRNGVKLLEEVGDWWEWINCVWFLGTIAMAVGDYVKARKRFEQALHVAQLHHTPYNLIYILRELGQLELDLGNDDDAEEWLEQGIKPLSEAGFQRLEGFFHLGLGVVARRRGRFDEAAQRFDNGMSLFRSSNEPRGVGMSLQNMGDLAMEERRFGDAERLYRESLSHFEGIDFRLGVASVLCNLGLALAPDPEQHNLAREHFERALDMATDIGATPVSLHALLGLSSLAAKDDSSREEAAKWLAKVLIHPAGKHETKEKARRLMADLITEMGQERVDEAVQRGEAKKLDEILAEALSLETATIP